MKKWFTASSYYIKVEGNNFINFFNVLLKNGIEVYNIKRCEVGVLEGIVMRKDYKSIVSITKHLGFSLTILQAFGLTKLIKDAKYRIGLVVGCLLSFALLIVLNQFTFNYKILGIENISYSEVESCIEEFGIKKHAINTFEVKRLEQHLANNISNISMVSVVKKGTTLIVNIKEKLPDIQVEHQPIVAEYNMYITKLDVFAGFSNLAVGDSVLAGDVLVHPYIFDSKGEIIKCKPVADIEAKVWFSASETFYTSQKVLVRTGKTIKNSYYTIGQARFLISNQSNAFTVYESEEKTVVINDFLLPIKLHTTTYFECEKQTIKQDFEKEKNIITNRLMMQAKKQVPTNILIEDEKVVISSGQDKHTISVYLQATIVVKEEE